MTEVLEAEFGPPSPFEPPAWVAGELGRPTGKGIVVAVIDSGWDRTCNDPRVLPGVGLVDPGNDLAMLRTDDDHDRVGHGTACIHQILRIAPDARVIPVRVFGNRLETNPATLRAGILYAMERGAKVVNLSLGTRLEDTLYPWYTACELARRQGMIMVAAADNSRDWSYPAVFEPVIGVGADRFESPYHYRYKVDDATEIEAWGLEQPVIWLGGEEQVKHGTSFAAPNITGIVCLLLERHPGATLEEIRELLARYASETIAAKEEDAEPAATGKPSKPSKPRARKPKAVKAEKPSSAKADAKPRASKPSLAKPAAEKPAAKSTAKKPRESAADQSTAKTSRTSTAAADQPAAKTSRTSTATDRPAGKKSRATDTTAAKAPAAKRTREPAASADQSVAKRPREADAAAEQPATRKPRPRRAKVTSKA